ncbi:DNA mismatch repair protein MutL, partial [Candidatus Falkowbacteria bacterium]|nr:DNA mismatch repair protein MutL [Candidatus Falkowbacteria bacterium]
MSIKILNQDLINQIAAGEVVERPASVVKELVENSIDAGAQNISIEIKNGGINLIKVSDDGAGMNREDAELSIKQHATSKLSTTEDLYQINTMGFRGEALASISSVSQFKLITKDNESVAGTIVEIVHNDCNIREIGSPVGTSIEVADLFYNVPAR